jgi:hypothetical protein
MDWNCLTSDVVSRWFEYFGKAYGIVFYLIEVGIGTLTLVKLLDNTLGIAGCVLTKILCLFGSLGDFANGLSGIMTPLMHSSTLNIEAPLIILCL